MRGPGLPLEDDTIVAISTPFGVGGIGIVRLSGPDAEKIAYSKRIRFKKALVVPKVII